MGKHFKPEKTYIYLLRCPIDNSPKYVGKSNDPNKRKDCHKSKSKTKDNPLSKWIRELNENNLKPRIDKFVIHRHRLLGFVPQRQPILSMFL